MPRPALAVARAGQEFVGKMGDRRGSIDDGRLAEVAHFIRRRRQADQVEIKASHELLRGRRRRRLEALASQSGEDETIDFILRPVAAHLWNGRLAHGLERPPFPLLVGDLTFRALRHLLPLLLRHRRASLHPLGEQRDLFVAQLLVLRRHLQVRVFVRHRREQQALRDIVRHDGRTTIPAAQNAARGVEHQPALDLVAVTMALETVLAEDGLDRRGEKLNALHVVGPGGKRKQQEEENETEELHDGRLMCATDVG